jgi:hypothetical protein
MLIRELTFHNFPHSPKRDFDFSAFSEDYEVGDPVGFGRTKEEAINDLKEKMCSTQGVVL